MVRWSKGPTAVVGRLDLSLTKECEGGEGDGGQSSGNGGFGHLSLMIVPVILSDCRWI